MPEPKQHRALLAVRNKAALSALRGYFRERSDFVARSAGADLSESIRDERPCILILDLEEDDRHCRMLHQEFPDLPLVPVLPAFFAPMAGALALNTSELDLRLASLTHPLWCPSRAAGSGTAPRSSPFDLPMLFNSSPRMVEIRDTIAKVANTCATVLIRGESGVGKEIAARMIFMLSERREKPFVKVNCAAIPNDLLESELFGYEAGAFTGAQRAKPGKFEMAHGGTLFLDEIGEMHPALQAKLLHVLQDGEFARLGAKKDTTVDVRVICATNRLLEARVAEGLFREDLFYRINVVTVNVPPLRERRMEIPSLVHYFLDRYGSLYQRTPAPMSGEVLDAMSGYSWPGNIRELENFCKRYVIMGNADALLREIRSRPVNTAKEDAPAAKNSLRSQNVLAVPAEPSLLEIGRQAAWQAEREAIERMLLATRWNRREAARRLRVSYKALLNKIKQIEHEKLAKTGT